MRKSIHNTFPKAVGATSTQIHNPSQHLVYMSWHVAVCFCLVDETSTLSHPMTLGNYRYGLQLICKQDVGLGYICLACWMYV